MPNFDFETQSCTSCGAAALPEELREELCPFCHQDSRTSCHECGNSMTRSRSRGSSREVCENCLSNYEECEDCGEEFSPRRLRNGVCRNCEQERRVHNTWEFQSYRPGTGVTYNLTGSQRKYGIELETSSCPNHQQLRNLCIFGCKEDGSVDGMEFVSPPMWGDQGYEQTKILCRFARENRFEIDAACGFHIHINLNDVREDDKLRAVALGYLYTEDVWQKFVSKARARNYYCTSVDYGELDVLEARNFGSFVENSSCDGTRYNWVNWHAWSRFNTVEIRLHSPTLNYRKITNWNTAHLRFVDFCLDLDIDGVQDMFRDKEDAEIFSALSQIWNDESLTTYFKDRAEHFGNEFSNRNALAIS